MTGDEAFKVIVVHESAADVERERAAWDAHRRRCWRKYAIIASGIVAGPLFAKPCPECARLEDRYLAQLREFLSVTRRIVLD